MPRTYMDAMRFLMVKCQVVVMFDTVVGYEAELLRATFMLLEQIYTSISKESAQVCSKVAEPVFHSRGRPCNINPRACRCFFSSNNLNRFEWLACVDSHLSPHSPLLR
jgi:hypothetical protein